MSNATKYMIKNNTRLNTRMINAKMILNDIYYKYRVDFIKKSYGSEL